MSTPRRLVAAARRAARGEFFRNYALQRWAPVSAIFVVLTAMGVYWQACYWRGERGTPPSTRLYLPGRFDHEGPLFRVRVTPGPRCVDVEPVAPRVDVERGSGSPACARSVHVWVEDARVEIALDTRGIPVLSIAGARLFRGAVVGSSFAPEEGVAVPLRSYAVPAAAGVVEGCPGAPSTVCLRVDDRLGRLALLRVPNGPAKDCAVAPTDTVARVTGDNPLRAGQFYPLRTGDELWLGLAAYCTRVVDDPRRGPGIELHQRPAPRQGGRSAWLSRLWPTERPERPASGAIPDSMYTVFAYAALHTPRNLTRERRSLEAEDVLQAVIDAEWLCYSPATLRVEWRPLERPGCDAPVPRGGDDRAYRRARNSNLAGLITRVVERTNRLLGEDALLTEPSALPLAFEWELQYRDSPPVGVQPVQPRPVRLWGVRFGSLVSSTREPHRRESALPPVVLGPPGARHVVHLERLGAPPLRLTLPTPRVAGGSPGARRICIGPHGARALGGTPGTTLPLGFVGIAEDGAAPGWSADPATRCDGCRLSIADSAEAGGSLRVQTSGPCDALRARGAPIPAAYRWAPGDTLFWEGRSRVQFRHEFLPHGAVVATTDGRTGRRAYARDYYLDAGAAPVVGDPWALAGVEKALRDHAAAVPPGGATAPVALTLDPDLQWAAFSIVAQIADAAVHAPERRPGPAVSAVIFDAERGAVLAAVNWPLTEAVRAPDSPPAASAWDLDSGQTTPFQNAAFTRRGPVGSTAKVTGLYLLANTRGSLPGAGTVELAGEGRLPLVFRDRAGGRREEAVLNVSAGAGRCRHVLPADGIHFSREDVAFQFRESCNSFFQLVGVQYAGAPAAPLRAGNGARRQGDPHTADVAAAGGALQVFTPGRNWLYGRILAGLAADGNPARPPSSLSGTLFRAGFQPVPGGADWLAPSSGLSLRYRGAAVEVPLVNDWLDGGPSGVQLVPGRDFNYPSVPSPGTFWEDTVGSTPEIETFLRDGTAEVRRIGRNEAVFGPRADAGLGFLMIGQGHYRSSALGLAALYGPAAHSRGWAVSPCLVESGCAGPRSGRLVLDPTGREVVTAALQAVVRAGTAWRALAPDVRGELVAAGWGGKTGTITPPPPPGSRVLPGEFDWPKHLWHACGVRGVPLPPPDERGAGLHAALAKRGSSLPADSLLSIFVGAPGRGAGASACEALNPGGVQRFAPLGWADLLDRAASVFGPRAGAAESAESHHAFVAVAPPRPGWPSSGIVVVVIVDDAADIAVEIGGELARAVERWARFSR
ncbi:hypothetical protein [Longimicrobium sp.]|uniref:hypothetical protein n=1 Tax=Longimicrobium sp. TaxID=2029185 RepID=UPI003B3AB0E7